MRERLRGEQSELNWLMRTSYIAHDAPGKAKQRDAAALSNGTADDAGSRQELLDDIEVPTFLTCMRLPTHTGPCVDVLPSGMVSEGSCQGSGSIIVLCAPHGGLWRGPTC